MLFRSISSVLPSGEWRSAKLVLKEAVGPNGKENAVTYGTFFGSVVDFLIIAFVVYMITKALIKEPAAAPAPPSKTCPRCKETVPVDASRCKFCTSDI